ncbi:hypothetical protein chiPu_0017522 [Chiloscyllium punctatum]|uniref:Anti-proliferative protein domain-containing protein n=1 Tax=Chiloscyllium punctatum TaxID=137246 RepID=A0A401RGQ0_CHIPU|nr:hypothetical protein [Chiloscyllium punctatum]
MEEEIRAAVMFLVSLVIRQSDLAQDKVKEFGERLTTVLRQKYQGHWYPTNPSKGQAYRDLYQSAAVWPQYPHKLVQYATFYQPVPLVSYYLMPRLDKVLRPPPGLLLSQGQTQRSKIGKRYK